MKSCAFSGERTRKAKTGTIRDFGVTPDFLRPGCYSSRKGRMAMRPVSCKHRGLAPGAIRLTFWLHLNFALRPPRVEEVPAQRGIESGCERIFLPITGIQTADWVGHSMLQRRTAGAR